jgi:hypothetical protein
MLFENGSGHVAFLGGRRNIDYIIPAPWESRFSIIREAIEDLIEKTCSAGPDARIRITIDEMVPSHNAYFGAMLPELGFDMVPRIEMK